MKRRRFLAASGVVVGGTVGTAGCLGSASGAPPRESEVFESIYFEDGALIIEIEDTPVVQSRVRLDTQGALNAPGGALSSLAPIGVARAQSNETGATGRGEGGAEDAPEGRNGRAKWRGGDYSQWWDENGDKVSEYEADVVDVGVFYFGSAERYRDDPPGATPPDWDKLFTKPEKRNRYLTDFEEGWYRVGGRLNAANADHNFSWEYVDMAVESKTSDDESANATDGTTGNATESIETSSDGPPLEITTQWKVSAGL
ncbi:hypothetical protein [Halorientalis salina]|uniref:hypothetical protein n=1 Tax=Halorientalis salina TaxID=2932266 RepID=UPI00145CC619|nr:hypothetical protein [Halorientalis salina]